jgi:hypothetical protein
MALSAKCRKRLEVAMARRAEAKELADTIDTGFNATPAASIAALGSTVNIPVVNVTLSTSDTYTDAAVKTAIDAGANAVRTAAETRLDNIEAKVDALLAALVTAGLML